MTTDLFRLAAALPTVLKLKTVVERAARGDAEAVDYLKREGVYEALDAWKPGAGGLAKELAGQAIAFVRDQAPDVIDGEFREIPERLPWQGFVKRLFTQPSGGHIVLGPMGAGKTSLAVKLASQWHRGLGYKAECVSMYFDDVPDFASIIDVDTLIKRMKRLQRYLRSMAEPDDDDDAQPEEPEPKDSGPATPPSPDRIVIIDEASLSMSNTAMDPGRRAALQALAQSRHLRWHVLYLAQWSGQLPLPLLGQSTVWVKKPHGDERDTDRDNPRVKQLWEEAAEAFEGLKRSPYYRPPHNDERAWVFVDSKVLEYKGLVPFTPYRGGLGDGEQAG